MASLGAENLNDGIVVVSTRSVDGHTGRLVNDNTDRSAGHGRFVAVGGMRDNLAVLDDSISAGGLAVDADQAVIECGPLIDILLALTARS